MNGGVRGMKENHYGCGGEGKGGGGRKIYFGAMKSSRREHNFKSTINAF